MNTPEDVKQCKICGQPVQDNHLDYCDFCMDDNTVEFDGFWYGSAR